MKSLKEELIDFAKWYSKRNDELFRITSYDIDKYLKSRNSDAQAESPTVGDNEAKEKYCKFCGEPIGRKHKIWCKKYV
jgi:hypothetical protein